MRRTQYAALCTIALAQLLTYGGPRHNASPSAPTGWYWLNPLKREPRAGDYVAFCIPRRVVHAEPQLREYLGAGHCPHGTGPLLKVVAAVPGDRVEVAASGISVNGRRWPHSRAHATDSHGRPLPRQSGRLTLKAGSYLFLSVNCDHGFDSRYFGPVSIEDVLGIASLMHRTPR